MASSLQVKQYLANWLQLGKKVYTHSGNLILSPSRIFHDLDYTPEFDQCWASILSDQSGDCYLEGSIETISQLLSPEWELVDCARCSMSIPLRGLGMPPESCPCNDLPNWPNTAVPSPISRLAVQSKSIDMQQRLDRDCY